MHSRGGLSPSPPRHLAPRVNPGRSQPHPSLFYTPSSYTPRPLVRTQEKACSSDSRFRRKLSGTWDDWTISAVSGSNALLHRHRHPRDSLFSPGLAFTRYGFTSRLLCTNQSSVYCPLPPALRALLQYYCTSMEQYTTPPRPTFCMAYTIQYWQWQYRVKANPRASSPRPCPHFSYVRIDPGDPTGPV